MDNSKLKKRILSQEDLFNLSELFKLMKPRVMSLVIFTCAVGLLTAPNLVSTKDAIIGILLVSLGAGAPAPNETNKIPIIASFVETRFGAVNKPTAHVKITKDITLGFINLNNSDKLNKSSCDKILFFNFELSINFLSFYFSYVIFLFLDHQQTLAIPQMYGNLVETAQSILKL